MPELKRDEIKKIQCIPSDLSKRDPKKLFSCRLFWYRYLILIGSFSKGDVNENSDIGLFVLMPSTRTGRESVFSQAENSQSKLWCKYDTKDPDEIRALHGHKV